MADMASSSSSSRKSKGRRKVDMVKMPNESNLQVTFSKRRNGLFKKASELCTLCGVDVAIIVFSPGKKVFSFGHPCVESVVDRYLTRNPPQNSGTTELVEAYRNATIRDLNMQLTQVMGQLELEKKRSEELNKLKKASQAQCWWEKPVDELELPQLEQLKMALEELKNNVGKQAEKVFMQNSNPPAPQFFAGSSSSGGGVGASTGPPGGMNNILPFESNWNNTINNNNNNEAHAVFDPSMLPPLPGPGFNHPGPGFNHPGFGHGFY